MTKIKKCIDLNNNNERVWGECPGISLSKIVHYCINSAKKMHVVVFDYSSAVNLAKNKLSFRYVSTKMLKYDNIVMDIDVTYIKCTF